MGKISNVRENNNIVEMTIFDGTGTYMVHYYSNEVDDAVRITLSPHACFFRSLKNRAVVLQ